MALSPTLQTDDTYTVQAGPQAPKTRIHVFDYTPTEVHIRVAGTGTSQAGRDLLRIPVFDISKHLSWLHRKGFTDPATPIPDAEYHHLARAIASVLDRGRGIRIDRLSQREAPALCAGRDGRAHAATPATPADVALARFRDAIAEHGSALQPWIGTDGRYVAAVRLVRAVFRTYWDVHACVAPLAPFLDGRPIGCHNAGPVADLVDVAATVYRWVIRVLMDDYAQRPGRREGAELDKNDGGDDDDGRACDVQLDPDAEEETSEFSWFAMCEITRCYSALLAADRVADLQTRVLAHAKALAGGGYTLADANLCSQSSCPTKPDPDCGKVLTGSTPDPGSGTALEPTPVLLSPTLDKKAESEMYVCSGCCSDDGDVSDSASTTSLTGAEMDDLAAHYGSLPARPGTVAVAVAECDPFATEFLARVLDLLNASEFFLLAGVVEFLVPEREIEKLVAAEEEEEECGHVQGQAQEQEQEQEQKCERGGSATGDGDADNNSLRSADRTKAAVVKFWKALGLETRTTKSEHVL